MGVTPKEKNQIVELGEFVQELTELVDCSPCSYEDLIAALENQINWLRKARKDEHGSTSFDKREKE